MLFCPKCKSIMIPKKKDKKTLMACRCGFTSSELSDSKISEKVESSGPVEVIDKEIETNPLTDAECTKCSHDKAYYWLVQTRASDEAPTRFFKCEKCSHQWREYS